AIEEMKFNLMRESDPTENQMKLLKFLRSRGSIVLFITAVSSSMEEILNRKISNLFRLEFKDDLSIERAIEMWDPIIGVLASFSDTLNQGLSDGIKNTDRINNTLNQFKQL